MSQTSPHDELPPPLSDREVMELLLTGNTDILANCSGDQLIRLRVPYKNLSNEREQQLIADNERVYQALLAEMARKEVAY
jgi:hypothetical protein